jgi:steroid delta-isomerase-like uncharacterized protein
MSTKSKLWVLGCFGLGLLFMTGCATMSEVEKNNMDVVRREYDEAWNQKNLDVIDEIYAPDYVGWDPRQVVEGSEGFKQMLQMMFIGVPDVQMTIEDIFASGDRVAVRWSTTSTHTGDLMGIPPSGKDAGTTGLIIYRLENGKIVEHWCIWDFFGMMQKIGVIPPMEPG